MLSPHRVLRRFLAAQTEKIPGGLAKGKKPEDFDPKTLAKGVKVELEHTKDEGLAREIAMDHLTEDPEYYDKLEAIEKKAMNYSYKRTAGYPGPLAPLVKKAQQATLEELKALKAIQQAFEAWTALHRKNYVDGWKPLREALETAEPGWYRSDWADQNVGYAVRHALEYGIGGHDTRTLQEEQKKLGEAIKEILQNGERIVENIVVLAQWQPPER